MTVTNQNPGPLTQPAPKRSSVAPRARRDQLAAVVAGFGFLVLAQLLQTFVLKPQREQIVQENESSLQSLLVTFPRLTLGGFRGLVSTALWLQAEQDKQDRNWFDLETKYDMIAALQPYFTEVYTYHGWNQAYNLSAQWHDVDTKYKWVLDGLAYIYGGEKYIPENPDLAQEEANMYYLKLGGAFERIFYREHWRTDIARLHELAENPLKKGNDVDTLQHVYDFVTRPEFHAQLLGDSSGASKSPGYGISITDGDLFQHRTDGKHPEDPVEFRHGVSPYYFAYVAFNRCNAFGVPSMTGPMVLDSEPGMSLRLWCRDDLYSSGQMMNAMFNMRIPEMLKSPVFENSVAEARDAYRNVEMIAPRAIELLQLHILKYKQDTSTHTKHVLETKTYALIGAAESKLFESLLVLNQGGGKMTDTMKIRLTGILPDYDKAIAAALAWLDGTYPIVEGQPYPALRSDLEIYRENLLARKAGIEAMIKTDVGQVPDMGFLDGDVVER